ncbi:pilus assembly protein Flp/PilA [Enterobacter sp. BIGb0383]|uniref:Flp family type IVb pilin n=1 Tax=unclassified Enterobacter TaxID=2608935 RepID=UPI000F47F845|nr:MULTISPECIES: Flp family type IVb pilin [unclassified Enterobacter]ROP59629.1 pilus assembly protein Flp/PilA [Enterobacter sp. BIGb0383]ROS08903.1 pilus assembly protein Flp/PilA [Enterobacter sp. BIGb0359]
MNTMSLIEGASISAYVKMAQAVEAVRRFKMDERGVTAVEYAIVLAGVAGVVAIIFGRNGTVSGMLTGIFNTIQTNVTANLPTTNTPAP